MRRVVVLAEASEDLADARRFYDAREPGVGDYCVTYHMLISSCAMALTARGWRVKVSHTSI
jgi:hypothetical protein